MKSVDEARQSVANAQPAEWPFRVSELGHLLEKELSQPEVLIDVANRLLDIATLHDCDAIMGASRIGGQLAGAVVALASNGLRLYSSSEPSDSVLVVDGILATGTQITRSVRVVQEAGAKRVHVAAVAANHVALELCEKATGSKIDALSEF